MRRAIATGFAQTPAAPYSTDTVHVWVNSDTADGETAALEYRINNTYTKVNCNYDTSYSGADWRCDIPAQPTGTIVTYQLFTYNQSGSDYGYTGLNWTYTVQGGNIHWDGLFADQSPFFMSPTQVKTGGTLTLRLRALHGD